MSAFLRGAIFGCIALALGIQVYRPARVNPPVLAARTLEAVVAVPPAVEQILARSCNDCHSNQTRWPWYSNIAPMSWMIADHVTDGRRHLNFSEWLRPGIDDPAEYTSKIHIDLSGAKTWQDAFIVLRVFTSRDLALFDPSPDDLRLERSGCLQRGQLTIEAAFGAQIELAAGLA